MDTLEADMVRLEEAMRLFFQTMKRPQQWARVITRAGINIDRPAAQILHILSAQDSRPCRVQAMATQLGIEAPSVSRKAQALEQAGYLRRLHDPLDKRAIDLQATARGRRASRRLWEAQRQIMSQVLSDWPAVERQRFVALFERFSAGLAGKPTSIEIPTRN